MTEAEDQPTRFIPPGERRLLTSRNEIGGFIWQVYFCTQAEALIIAAHAANALYSDVRWGDPIPDDAKETSPDWRESESGRRLVAAAAAMPPLGKGVAFNLRYGNAL